MSGTAAFSDAVMDAGTVFWNGPCGQQVVLLEDESEILSAKIDLLIRRQEMGAFAKELDLALAGIEQAGDDAQQGGFAATAGADDECQFAIPCLKIDTAQRFHARAVASKPLAECARRYGDGAKVVHSSTSKDLGRLQHHDPADTQQTGNDDDEKDAGAGENDVLPHQHEATRG